LFFVPIFLNDGFLLDCKIIKVKADYVTHI